MPSEAGLCSHNFHMWPKVPLHILSHSGYQTTLKKKQLSQLSRIDRPYVYNKEWPNSMQIHQVRSRTHQCVLPWKPTVKGFTKINHPVIYHWGNI